MKKLTALLLAVLLICSTMIGCKQEDIPGDESTENGTESKTTQPQNGPFIEGILDDYDKEESQKGFTIKGKKYPYNDNDVLILEVENTTDTHYSTTFVVTFYDEAGEIVKTQKKSLEQFPAEYKQACVFQPECQFDSYTCKLYVGEYTGVDYLSTLSCGKYTKEVHGWVGEPKTSYYIRTQGNFGPCTIIPEGNRMRVWCDVVLFDNTGKIYIIKQSPLFFDNTDITKLSNNDMLLLESKEDLNMQIPEELTGELTVIVAPTRFDFVTNFRVE